MVRGCPPTLALETPPERATKQVPMKVAGGVPRSVIVAAIAWTLTVPPVVPVTAQEPTGTVTVHATAAGGPLAEAEVQGGRVRARTDSAGLARLLLVAGPRQLLVRKVGFAPETLLVVVRADGDTMVEVSLREQPLELEPVIVSATRTEGRVEEEPTRVEVIAHEEVEEKSAMAPAAIAPLLGESNGTRVQTTSAALGAASIRIQGMRGRYTQVLSDGLPLYGATTAGLGLLQIPPVDLDHVEVIKGVASALYGGSALGGVVDLISRRPVDETDALLNQTSRAGTDAILWTSRRLGGGLAYSLLASANGQRSQDLNGDGWADLAAYERGVIRPRLYWSDQQGRSVFITTGATVEDREGGTLAASAYPVSLRTQRYDLGGVGRLPMLSAGVLTLRASTTTELLRHRYGGSVQRDRHATAFGEAALTSTLGRHVSVAGLAWQYDAYKAKDVAGFDYEYATPGVFLQDTYRASEHLALTGSARLDHHSRYGTFLSPRISLLVRPSAGWSARLSAGSGYYAPTPFTEETEPIGLGQVRPLGSIKAERARSASADVGGTVGPFEMHGTLFGSLIDNAVALTGPDSTGRLTFVNLGGPTRTYGTEVLVRYRYRDFQADATYSFTRATEVDPGTGLRRDVPLTPRHQAGLDFLIELEDTRFGLEGFYTGPQSLENDPYRTRSRPYVLVGLLAQHRFGPVLVFANGENLFDIRQTRYDPLLLTTPGPGGRRTTDVWAPLEGRVLNVGVRLGENERAERR